MQQEHYSLEDLLNLQLASSATPTQQPELQAQQEHDDYDTAALDTEATPALAEAPAPAPAPAPAEAPAAPAPQAGTPRQRAFVEQYAGIAQTTGQKLGVAPEILLSQWALETGWGKSIIPGTRNLGNIKDSSGQGPKARDNMTGSVDSYRAYETDEDFANDYARLIGGNQRYAGAAGSGDDARHYFTTLKRGGYAEDPLYIPKATSITNTIRQITGGQLGQSTPNTPAPLTQEQMMQALGVDFGAGQAIPDKLERSGGQLAKDVALSLGQGAAGGIKTITDIFGADNPVSQTLDEASKTLGQSKSEYSRYLTEDNQQRIKEAEANGWQQELSAYWDAFWDNPAEMVAQGAGSFIPFIATSYLGGSAKALQIASAAKAAGMSKTAFLATPAGQAVNQQLAQAVTRAVTRANMAMGGAMGLGGVKGSQYEQTEQAALAAGHTPEQAQQLAVQAQEYSLQNLPQHALGTALGVANVVLGPIEKALSRVPGAGQAASGYSGNLLARAAKGTAAEMPIEMVQDAQQRIAGNTAAIDQGVLDESQRYTGAAGQALQAGLSVAPLGAAGGVMHKAAPAAAPEHTPGIAPEAAAEATTEAADPTNYDIPAQTRQEQERQRQAQQADPNAPTPQQPLTQQWDMAELEVPAATRREQQQQAQQQQPDTEIDVTYQGADGNQVTEVIPEAAQPEADPLQAQQDRAWQPAPQATEPVLQNRDRSTASSIEQMQAIAAAPNYLKVGPSTTMDSGAPIVFGTSLPESAVFGNQQQVTDAFDNTLTTQYAVVEAADILTSNHADGSTNPDYAQGQAGKLRTVAGNGRAAGLAESYTRGNADEYRQALTQQAQTLGIDPQAIEAMQAPMLVRLMDEADITTDIGDRSNIQSGLQMNPVEQAANDLRRLQDAGLNFAALEFDETGNPTAKTVSAFINAMPQTERGNMRMSDDNPTRQVQERIGAAAFKQAYQNDALVELATMATDEESKRIITAMRRVAPDMAALSGAGDMDTRKAVSDAAVMAINAKRRGIPLRDMVAMPDLDADPEAFTVAQFFADNISSGKRIEDGLRNWANLIEQQIQTQRNNQSQSGMFGATPTLSRGQIFDRLNPSGNSTAAFTQNHAAPSTEPAQAPNFSHPLDAQSQQQEGEQYEQRNEYPSGIPAGLPAQRNAESAKLEREINRELRRIGQPDGFQAAIVEETQLSDALSRALGAFRRATGTRVAVFRNLTPEVFNFNGVNFRDGVAWVNEASEHPLTLTAAHEWLHNLKRTDPAIYQSLAREVIRQGDLTGWAHVLREQGEGRWRDMDLVTEELTAAAVSDALTDPAFLQRLAQRDQSTFKRVARAFLDFLNTLTAQWKDQGSNAYLRDVEAFRDKLEQILDALPQQQAQPVPEAQSKPNQEPAEPVSPQAQAITAAANEAATSPANDLPQPTEAQKKSGNYKKGHIRLNGLDIAIENPAGSIRSPEWPPLQNHYGYINGTVGADKDHVDVFITDRAHEAGLPVFVVDQVNQDGSFDEHKVVLGAADEAEARSTYLGNYEKGWTGLGAITQMSQEQFKAWVHNPTKTKKPAGNLTRNAQQQAQSTPEPETGSFGPIFPGYTNDPEGAIEKLMAEKRGEVADAFIHPELGSIAFVYGNEAMGLRHIEAKRGMVWVEQIPEILRTGRLERDTKVPRAYLVQDSSLAKAAVIRLDWDGEQKTWLVTAHPDDVGKWSGGDKTSRTATENSGLVQGNPSQSTPQKEGAGAGTSMDTASNDSKGDTARLEPSSEMSVPADRASSKPTLSVTELSALDAKQVRAHARALGLPVMDGLRPLKKSELIAAIEQHQQAQEAPAPKFSRSASTQARQRMTDAERRATPPSATADVADSDVIVTFNGKEMHSAPLPANAAQVQEQATPRTPVTAIRAALTKAYGKLLDKLEAQGLVTLTQTQEEAIDAAAQARAAVTGESVQDVKRSLMESVKNQKAWHGTPHRGIEKTGFELNKIGTGAGQKLYGWGMYFASSKDIAEGYRTSLSKQHGTLRLDGQEVEGSLYTDVFYDALASVFEVGKEAALRLLDANIERTSDPHSYSYNPDRAAKYQAVKKRVEPIDEWRVSRDPGTLYRVEIPEDDVLLDWNKPLSGQPQKVKAALKSLSLPLMENQTGEDIYQRLQEIWKNRNDGHWAGSERAASEALLAVGIPGLRYEDTTSSRGNRGNDEDTASHSYVIWDEALLTAEAAQIEDHYPSPQLLESRNGAVEGFHDPVSGKTFLIADALTEETAPGTLMHEIGIHMAADGNSKMQKLIARADLLRSKWQGNPFVQQAQERMEQAGETSNEEFLAYVVTQYENGKGKMPITFKLLARDFIAAVRAWLHGKGWLDTDSLSVADLAAIARANAKRLANEGGSRQASGRLQRSTAEDAQLAQAQRQFAETERAYGGRAAYDKAKAAGKTKLNYGQWVQVRTPNFKEWFGDWENDPEDASQVVDPATGEPLMVYHGTNADFSEFDASKNKRHAASALGFFASANPSVAEDFAGQYFDWDAMDTAFREGGNIMPVYVSLNNPATIPAAEFARRFLTGNESVSAWRNSLIAAGFDGVHIQGSSDAAKRLSTRELGSDSYVAFRPEQIKSATGNRGTFDPANADIRFSRAAQPNYSNYTPAQQQAAQHAFGSAPSLTLRQRFDQLRANAGAKLRQGIVDQFAPIKDFDNTAYILARMTKGTDGAVEAAMLYGKPYLKDGVLDVDVQDPDGGFASVLASLKGEHDRFLQWVAAQRSKQLKAQGRENLLTDQDISSLLTLSHGNMADGSRRQAVYDNALRQLNSFNDAVLKVALQSGLIDQAAHDIMAGQPYVPFYRLMEETGDLQGPRFSAGLVNQQAWKRLKGGTEQIQSYSHCYASSRQG